MQDLKEKINELVETLDKSNVLVSSLQNEVSKKDVEWELRANKRVFEAKMLKDLEIKELQQQLKNKEEDIQQFLQIKGTEMVGKIDRVMKNEIQELKSKLEEKEKEINCVKNHPRTKPLNCCYGDRLELKSLRELYKNSIPKSEIKLFFGSKKRFGHDKDIIDEWIKELKL